MIDVKKLREKCGLTQQDLAEKCGVTLRTVQNWEKGKTIPESALRLLQTIGNNGETISSFASDNAVSVAAGRGSNVNVGTETERFISAIERQQEIMSRHLDEIQAQRSLVVKAQEQIDRLIGLLEKK